MKYPSIRIEGSILSHDILERIEDMPGQKPIDFGFDSSFKVKDEIARAWADAQDYWRIFQRKIENLKPDSAATTETRQQWIAPLLGLLGYQLEYQPKGTELNGKIYNISHAASNRSQMPVQIIGYGEPAGLDRKPERSKLRMSAHAVVQEYLNLNDQLYGLVTNGRVLRLLRDSSRLIKLSYLEFDLDRIFTDGLFADFAILYRLLHATRMPLTNNSAAESLIERYHEDTIEQGTRIRDGLRAAVTEALEILGTGFIADSENQHLREQINGGGLEHTAFFSYLLRLIYRLLFLNVVEERGLIFPKEAPAKRLRIYFDYYSVQRLRQMARTRGLKSERHHDAWLSLLSTFRLFESPDQAAKLGTTAFCGQLFDPQSLGPLTACRLSNAALFHALDRLCSFDDPNTNQRLPVNFGALATEEFGSVYESLLELHPVIEMGPAPHFTFKEVGGNDRKISGSYYTPPGLVDCLLDSALDPVLDDRIRKYAALGYPSAEAAILSLKVCDPACGSGHFLIAAAQRIARRLAQLRAGDDEPSPDQTRHALREVISRCIYAVDINPMSVELCRVALWLEAVEPGKPLSFLDHHLRVGNSLLGATPKLIAEGIPDDAFTPIEGDDKKACAILKKRNRTERRGLGPLFAQQDAETQTRLQEIADSLADLPDDRPEDIRRKEAAFRLHEKTPEFLHKKEFADAWCAAFVIRKCFSEPGANSPHGLTQGHLNELADGRPLPPELDAEVHTLSGNYQFFHWHLAFPEVFARGGFDCIVGNPPWDKIQPEEEKFFSTIRPDITNAPSAKARKELIQALPLEDPSSHSLWEAYKRKIDATCHFLRSSSILRFTGDGNLNSYRVFTERAASLISLLGQVGLIVQTGFATDESGKELFDHLLTQGKLRRLLDFENRKKFFPDVHAMMRFALVTLSGDKPETGEGSAQFGWLLHSLEELDQPGRLVVLSANDLVLFNPSSRTCPVFTSAKDVEVSRRIYENSVHIYLEPTRRFGNIDFLGELFNMTRDSGHFISREAAAEVETLPLYEAKYIHQLDHRFATFANGEVNDATLEQKADPMFRAETSRVVVAQEVLSRLETRKINPRWLLGFRDISSPMNERTAIMAVFPVSAVGNSINMVHGLKAEDAACLAANVNSFAFDYSCRQKVSGTHVNIWIFKQLPVIALDRYSAPCAWATRSQTLRDWLLPRVLEETYTAWDLNLFAHDCGSDGPPFRWDDERRFLLRCEMDAAFFHLYLGPESEWHRQSEALSRAFATPRLAVEHIMDTFAIVKRRDEAKFDGDYRTKRVILEIYDAIAASVRTGQPYQTRLAPPPGAIECRHPRRKIGVLAYGSLIDDPGPELAAKIKMRLKTLTPFPVEYARISSGTRAGAPTLVPHHSGCPVSAEILVLDDDVSVEDAKSLLWRRETRKTGAEKYSEGTSPNSVLVRVIDTPCVISVLHTDFRDEGKIPNPTSDDLAKRAIESVGKADEGRDGISYLMNTMASGIQTSLTRSYCDEILKQTNTGSLTEALMKVKEQYVREEKAAV
jgi:hypothetical protein